MRLLRFCSCLILLLSISQFVFAQESDQTRIVLKWVSTPDSISPLIGLMFSDNQIHYFALDSGSAPMQMDRALAEKLKLPKQKRTFNGIDYDLVYSNADFGPHQITIPDIPFYLADFSVTRNEQYPTEGIIGITLLEHLILRMNYQTRTVEIFEPEKRNIDESVRKGTFAIPLEVSREKHYMLKGSIDGIPIDFVLDTGGDTTTLSNPTLLKKLKPKSRVTGIARGILNEANDKIVRIDSSSVRLKTLKIMDIEWNEPILSWELRGGSFDLNSLGNDFLQHFRVTIDFPGKKLYLTPVTNLQNDEEKWFGTGAALVYKSGHLFVSEVLKPSPASEVGVVVGDEILSVNGTILANLDVNAVLSLLRSMKKEDDFTVELRSSDEKHPKKVKLKHKKLL